MKHTSSVAGSAFLAALGLLVCAAGAQLPTGELLVVSTPAGAKVFLDGNEMPELTPFGPAELPVGEHTVEIRLGSFLPQRRNVRIAAGRSTHVSVSFAPPPGPSPPPLSKAPELPTAAALPAPARPEPKPEPAPSAVGSLRIESDPPGASVSLDNAARGRTPLELAALRVGEYSLRLELPGFVSHSGTVSVKDGELVVTSARLVPDAPGRAASGGGGGRSRVATPGPGAALPAIFAGLVVVSGTMVALIVVVRRRRGVVVRPTPPRGTRAQTALVFGDYVVSEKIAAGGMANIYKAADRITGALVAIKVPYEQYQNDHAFMERFRREGEFGKKLHNENIVKILGAGVTPAGLSFIAMEYIDGADLRHLMAQGLSVEAAVGFILQVCRALDYAHVKGIIHRDIKPENVMVTAGPARRAVLMDFGIARASFLGTVGTGSTYLGTPYYMAPEPANGREPGAYSDLYSVGVMLFELLARRRPFEGDNPVAVLQHHVSTPPPSVRQFASHVPAELDALVQRLLAKRPEDRYPSAEALIVDLQAFARHSRFA